MFRNPLLPSGADPWVAQLDGFYYYMNTTGRNLTIWKTRAMSQLASAERKVVWSPPASGPYSHDIWAPEIHWIGGKWYIYFAADAGGNETHRIYVVENASHDPLRGKWIFKGKVADATDKWAIDPSEFEDAGRMYLVWSGWEGDVNGQQNIYLARLQNPWTISGPRVLVSTPVYPWEKVGDLVHGTQIELLPHVDVNEGPEVLKHDGKLFLVYSASGCWTNYYELGMLQAKSGSDLTSPSSWTKSPRPVFWQNPEGKAYGTGHNGFFQSPDGKQDWILYHANPGPDQGCGGLRSPRMQPFKWNADGSPDFGRPVPLDEPLAKPSGEH